MVTALFFTNSLMSHVKYALLTGFHEIFELSSEVLEWDAVLHIVTFFKEILNKDQVCVHRIVGLLGFPVFDVCKNLSVML